MDGDGEGGEMGTFEATACDSCAGRLTLSSVMSENA